MPRERLPIGGQGEVRYIKEPDGRWVARVQVRDPDGVRREVRVRAVSRVAARTALEQRLRTRSADAPAGASARMTVAELAEYWLGHRTAHGRARGNGPLAPQTLAAYRDALQLIVVPAVGNLRLDELTVGRLDRALARIESGADGERGRDGRPGRSTAQARTVLSQMLLLAVRHGALVSNPMNLVEQTSRQNRGGRDIHHLTVVEARLLRTQARRETLRVPGRRMPNRDLEDWVDFVLGTGCRNGEALAVRWVDLNLDKDQPTVHICGTVVEPRRGYVEHVHRQPVTKTRSERTLILPDAVVAMLVERRRHRPTPNAAHDPGADGTSGGSDAAGDGATADAVEAGLVFGTGTGSPMSPANIRARLRRVTSGEPALLGCSPHTLRRTVGTLVAHEVGLDAARDQLGHSDPSVTFQDYVARRALGPDVRAVLDRFFAPEDP